MIEEIQILRSYRVEFETRVRDLEKQLADRADPAVSAAAENESLMAWLARVTRTSYRQGGVSLIMRRLLDRLQRRQRASVDN